MSGIYLHIPFCHHKCTYCDFHFSVHQKSLQKVLDAMVKEIEQRKDYLNTKKIQTIYFGGGTPSVLSLKHLEKLFNQLFAFFQWDKDTEITIECNPEDINAEYLSDLKSIGINRISLGVQSLNNELLKWMGRAHTVEHSVRSMELIKKAGIENFSADIIFGLPEYSKESIIKDIEYFINHFEPPHLSVYQLTIEPKTKLNYLFRRKKFIPADDEKIRDEFLSIQELLIKRGYVHYEISNYALNGYESKHNSSYWLQKPYIGIGPSAHSYNETERRWNVSNNYIYARNVLNNEVYYEKEVLNEQQKFNEYVYTRLRTKYGCDINAIEKQFGEKYKQHFLNVYHQNKAYFETDGNIYKLIPEKGYLLADKIAMEFFCV